MEYSSDAENHQVVALPAWRVFLALRGPGGPEVPDLSSELSLLSPQGPAERLEEERDGHLCWSSLCQPHTVEALAGPGL